jgi:hypothetical protein
MTSLISPADIGAAATIDLGLDAAWPGVAKSGQAQQEQQPLGAKQ